ncbi:hypothetical protein LCGC14_1715930 [marine sediment metagenome]|uniref:Uncharacterized protein n=1 Tax=marine sediment metagenome TaxID=412755 RepID=A0A0F9I1F1_9ZZZZ
MTASKNLAGPDNEGLATFALYGWDHAPWSTTKGYIAWLLTQPIVGYCDGALVEVRPRPADMAVMFDNGDYSGWNHIPKDVWKDFMEAITYQRMSGLVNMDVLGDFTTAAKALFHDLEYDVQDVRGFMLMAVNAAVIEAALEGPCTIENHPLLADAIKYVKRYVKDGKTRSAAELEAGALYSLDAEAVKVMKRHLGPGEIR